MAVELDVQCSDFLGAYAPLNGQQTLATSMNELLWSLVTCGHLPRFVLPFDFFRSEAIKMRLALALAHVELVGQAGDHRFAPSVEYRERCDPSEKGFVSYYVGSALAKLAAARLLDSPYLLHTSLYQHVLNVGFDPNNSRRPDFIGPQSNGQWIAVEAKGNQRWRTETMDTAKQQSQAITSINGVAPTLAVGSVALIHKDEISLRLADPPAGDDDGINLEIDLEDAMRLYYEPIVELLGEEIETTMFDDVDAVVVEIDEFDVTVGLVRSVWDRFDQGELSPLIEDPDAVRGFPGIGPDGVIVRAGSSWYPDTTAR